MSPSPPSVDAISAVPASAHSTPLHNRTVHNGLVRLQIAGGWTAVPKDRWVVGGVIRTSSMNELSQWNGFFYEVKPTSGCGIICHRRCT